MGIRVFLEELFSLIAGRPSELPKSCVFCCGRASKGGPNPSGIDPSLAAFGGLATTENATFWQFCGAPCDQGEKFFSKNSDSHIPKILEHPNDECLSARVLWPCHKNGLINTVPIIPWMSVSSWLCFTLEWIKAYPQVYPKPQQKAPDLKLRYRMLRRVPLELSWLALVLIKVGWKFFLKGYNFYGVEEVQGGALLKR